MNRKVSVFLVFAFVVLLIQLVPVFAEDMPPVYEPIDPYLATPAPGHLYEIPVVIMRFLPTADGENLDVSKASDYWTLGEISLEDLKAKIDVFDKRIKFMLEEGSRFRGYKDPSAPPSLGYRVVEYITVYEQIPPGPVIGHEKGYPIYAADFHQIFDRFNVEHYVNDLGVKEIWVWMGHVMPGFPSYDPKLHKPKDFRGWWESNMSSPLTGDISNSNRDDTDLPVYNSTYTVYGQNIRRTQAEAVHNHGHQLEAILSHVNHLQYGNTDLFWKKFVGQNDSDFITGRAGWTHMPPNTTKHYDYTGTRTLVNSDIEDWTPDNSGSQRLVNVDTYGNLAYPWPDPNPDSIPQRVESQWYIYWMQSMPGHKNRIRYGNKNMTNWWVFTADWDAATSSQMGLVSQTATELPQLRDPDSGGANRSVDLKAQNLSLLPSLKSKGGDTETAIVFENRTGAEIAYYWIDYKGNEIFYGNLAAATSVKRSTYEGHIWLVKDTNRRNLSVFRAVEKAGRAIIVPAPASPVVHIGAAQRLPIYWVAAETGTLHRLVGNEVENLVPAVQNATDIAVDTTGNKIYWTEQTGKNRGNIKRANLDGLNIQILATLASLPTSIVVDAAKGKLYWTNASGRIQRANLNGKQIRTLIKNLKTPSTIALDAAGDKLYWAENNGRIQRANLDGKSIQNVATGLGELLSLTAGDGKLYWLEKTTGTAGKLQRANLDGSNRRGLKTFKSVPTSITIDTVADKLYWTNPFGRIQWANLNGSNIQNIVTGLPVPTNIVLNPAADGEVLVFDDPFEGNTLQNPNWQWQNEPTDWDVGKTRKKFLHIEGETKRDLWITDTSHLLYQETSAKAFDVETHFFTRWNTFSGVNGLIVKSPTDNDWVTLKFWARDPRSRGQIQYQASGRGLAADPAWQPRIGKTELFFRLRKDMNTYTGWYKTRKTDPWIKIGTANIILTPPLRIGIYAGVAANTGTLAVDYAYFRSTINTSVQAAPTADTSIAVIPTEMALLPNYPNPFNPETWIPYQLAEPGNVKITIYDTQGSVVRHLDLGRQHAGTYTSRSRAAYWDGRNDLGERVASGLYFYTLEAGNFAATKKMLILK